MDKEAAQEQYDIMAGRAALAGAQQALIDTNHVKVAQHPDKIMQATQAMEEIMAKEAEMLQPLCEQSDMKGIDALIASRPSNNDD